MARKLKSDKWLFGAALFLVCVSVVMVYSALAGKAMDATGRELIVRLQLGGSVLLTLAAWALFVWFR